MQTFELKDSFFSDDAKANGFVFVVDARRGETWNNIVKPVLKSLPVKIRTQTSHVMRPFRTSFRAILPPCTS